jgi:site-specific recombinase XerD
MILTGNIKSSDISSVYSNDFLYSIWNFFAANLSERTRKNYYNIVRGYIKITGHNPDELTHSDADKYYNELVTKMNSGRLSRSTAIMRLAVMKSLCDYITHKKYIAGEVYTNFFRDYVIPEENKELATEALPSEDEINYLLEASKKAKDDTFTCILSLIVKCGLTTSELCRLEADSILYDKKNVICLNIRETRKVSRIIRLPADVNKIMKKYLKKSDIIGSDNYIFHNKRGTCLKPRDAERLLKQYVDNGIYDKKIGKAFTFQDLRHAAIKYMLMGNASNDEVAAYCGITTKWLPRYQRVVTDGNAITSADYSVISINMDGTTSRK